MPLKLLGVTGSLREGSYSTLGLRLCLDLAAQRGAECQLLDLGVTELPMFRPERIQSEAVAEAARRVDWADALLLATPDYHGSMSGAMKNFLDYHWHEFAGKLFGYLCASHEKGLTAMDQMRTAVRQCYGWSLPYGVAVHGEQDFDAAGQVVNPRLAARLAMLTRDLIVYGALLREQFARDLRAREQTSFCTRYTSD